MEYKAKRKAWDELLDTNHLDKDISLLRKKNSKARALDYVDRYKVNARGRLHKEILWGLLDNATVPEIQKNRVGRIVKPGMSPKVATELLLSADKIEKLDYEKEMKPVVKALKVVTKNNKKVTLIEALEVLKAKLKEEKENKAAAPEPGEGGSQEEKKKSNEGGGIPEDKVGQS